MTARGRATLLALLVSIGFWIGIGWPAGFSLASQTPPVAPLAPVAARSALRHVPDSVVARLPVSRAVLDLSVTNSDASARTASSPLAKSSSDDAGREAEAIDPATPGRFFEVVSKGEGYDEPLRIEYAFDAELTRRVFNILKTARVVRGHVVVLDIQTGRVLAYASADPVALPPQRAYPAASLAKVITGAASLEKNRTRARQPCFYRGNPYRLTKASVNPTRGGNEATLEKAMAGSYNQCFAQLAVHALGAEATVAAFQRFGWGVSPAAGHETGVIERGDGDYGLGKLGSGLAPTRITALHAAQLVATLDTGELVEPWWIDRVVNEAGESLVLPERGERRRVMSQAIADELRTLLVGTTQRGTARRAFRSGGGYRLGSVLVAGKTGNLSGPKPQARYEWFAGVAPANNPRIAVAVVQAQGPIWWHTSAQVAADVFAEMFCERNRCNGERIARYTSDLGRVASPLFLNESADSR